MYKKLISLLLVFAMVFTILLPQTASAAEASSQKHNFNFTSTIPSNIEYTYEENGKNYKVLENLNDDSTRISTKIYEKKVNSEYLLIENYKTTVLPNGDGNLEITKTQNGKKTTETLDLNTISQNLDLESLNNQQTASNIINTSMATTSMGEWEFIDQHTGSTFFQNYTVAVITGILVGIVSGGLGLSISASAVLGATASSISATSAPFLYYDRKVEYYREDGVVTRVRITTAFYYDSAHSSYINTDYTVVFGMFPW